MASSGEAAACNQLNDPHPTPYAHAGEPAAATEHAKGLFGVTLLSPAKCWTQTSISNQISICHKLHPFNNIRIDTDQTKGLKYTINKCIA